MKPADAKKPHLIITVGIPGAGKSFFAEHFAESFKAPLISLDKIHKELTSDNSDTKIADSAINNMASHMLDEVLKTGRTVVYEGPTSSRSDRRLVAKKAKDAGYESMFIWVQTEPATAKKRAMSGRQYASVADFNAKLKKFTAPSKLEKVIVISGKHTYPSQLKIVLSHLVNSTDKKPSGPVRPIIKRNYLIR